MNNVTRGALIDELAEMLEREPTGNEITRLLLSVELLLESFKKIKPFAGDYHFEEREHRKAYEDKEPA